MEKLYYVYILASRRNGTLYTGMTSDLAMRIYQHKNGLIKGFTKKYNVKILVYVETYKNVNDAIMREKRIKNGNANGKLI